MATERIAALAVAAAQGRSLPRSSVLGDYWALTKPDVNFLILITTLAGFCLARPIQSVGFPILLLFHTLLGTLLLASGTATLNQFVERRFDAQMRRTKRRPLAAGRIEPTRALWFGVLLSASGAIYLAAAVNFMASLIAVLTLLSYLLLYTPLKRKTPLCTLAGAFSGAAPPLIGWAAASGKLSLEAWVLYGMVFLWQFPHFMAIAWMYREDYERAGYLVLPRGERRNSFMAWQSVLPSLGLILLSLPPILLGKEGLIYTVAALLFSVCFLYYGGQLALRKTNTAARRLLLASILYLPLVFVLMVLDRT
jgi:protoheme IX farnesyltransferase